MPDNAPVPAQQNPTREQPGQGIERLPIPDSAGPNAHDAVSNPLGDGPNAFRNYFQRNLQAERDGTYRPGESSADPVLSPQQGQPPAPSAQSPQARPSSDIPESGGSQTPAEQPVLSEQPGEPVGQPAGLDEDGLEVDGERFTADRIRELFAELDEGTMRLDDYTRKTQLLSRVRQETEALGTVQNESALALERKAKIITDVVEANLRAYEQADLRNMTQEQHASYVQAYEQAKRGAQMLRDAFDKADDEYNQAKAKGQQHLSNSTVQLLRWHEPRWDMENTFYAELRQFVIKEGLMSQESFDEERDFLKIVGLISMMDRHKLPDTIKETREQPRPSERQHNQQQPRDPQGRFQRNLQTNQNAVLNSQNARRDGSARDFFMSKLEDERRRGVPAQPNRVT